MKKMLFFNFILKRMWRRKYGTVKTWKHDENSAWKNKERQRDVLELERREDSGVYLEKKEKTENGNFVWQNVR